MKVGDVQKCTHATKVVWPLAWKFSGLRIMTVVAGGNSARFGPARDYGSGLDEAIPAVASRAHEIHPAKPHRHRDSPIIAMLDTRSYTLSYVIRLCQDARPSSQATKDCCS
jgi:hypothetical protein